MSSTKDRAQLTSRVIKTEPVNWREFQYIQQEDFKELSKEAAGKLKASIVANNFTQPFYVWGDPESGKIYCLDGRHRTRMLEEMINEGVDVPFMLPATFIHCENIKEAASLVLVYSSIYAKVTADGFATFTEQYGINVDDIFKTIDLPGLDLPDLLSMSDSVFADPGTTVKNQYGIIVMCEGEQDQEKIFTQLSEQGYNCKVVVT